MTAHYHAGSVASTRPRTPLLNAAPLGWNSIRIAVPVRRREVSGRMGYPLDLGNFEYAARQSIEIEQPHDGE